MKNKSFFTGRVVVGSIACMLSLFFWSCEPEGLEVPTEQSSLKMAISDEGNMPHKEIAQVRASMAQFHNFDKAMEAGYNIPVTPFIPHMGYHWAKELPFDQTFEMLHPEILIYVPDSDGHQRFVGVEYIIPLGGEYTVDNAPEGFPGDSDEWVINPDIASWTLHMWIGLSNPDGMFKPLNMRIPATDPSEDQ